MKKIRLNDKKKLALQVETIRALRGDELVQVVGGLLRSANCRTELCTI